MAVFITLRIKLTTLHTLNNPVNHLSYIFLVNLFYPFTLFLL